MSGRQKTNCGWSPQSHAVPPAVTANCSFCLLQRFRERQPFLMWLFFSFWLQISDCYTPKLACLLLAVALPCLFAYQALSPHTLRLFGLKFGGIVRRTLSGTIPALRATIVQLKHWVFALCTIDLLIYCLCSLGLITTFQHLQKGSDFIIQKNGFYFKREWTEFKV